MRELSGWWEHWQIPRALEVKLRIWGTLHLRNHGVTHIRGSWVKDVRGLFASFDDSIKFFC